MADMNDDTTRRDAAAHQKGGVLKHDDNPGVGDHIGEAAGGISGVLTGAAIGSAGGPIGTIIGGIAGAVGGWWSGRTVSEAATKMTHGGDDDNFYRTHYEGHPSRLADRKYEDVRPAYQLGHVAGHNPDYAGKEFDHVESDLRRGWDKDVSSKHGEWEQVRPYARDAFQRGRTSSSSMGTGASAGTAAGMGAAGSMGSGAAAHGHGLADRAKDGASDLGHKIANAADDVKDRFDGNPASRPGPDSTDRR